MKVNVVLDPNILQNIFCFHRRKSYRFGKTWVKDDFNFMGNYPLRLFCKNAKIQETHRKYQRVSEEHIWFWGLDIFCQYSCMHLWQIKVNKQCCDSAPCEKEGRSANTIQTGKNVSRSDFKHLNDTIANTAPNSTWHPPTCQAWLETVFESFVFLSFFSLLHEPRCCAFCV